jgi:hypothetical protein
MRLRFSIRDLLWLTALIAMGVGWWLDHRNSIEKWSKVHYWVDPGTFAVHFTRGNIVDGAHKLQGNVEFPSE